MAELFDSNGFDINDEDSYNLLVECAEASGARSVIHRGDATLHGRCWKLGDGLEVWSVLYERKGEMYYADCRPAFRSRYVQTIQPWELIEYDEDGEAVVRGSTGPGTGVIFELQNLTEINAHVFRETQLHVALAGLAYTARAQPSTEPLGQRFDLADQLPEMADDACENDYLICGRVVAWREVMNPVTQSGLLWRYVDAGRMRLEVVINSNALLGQLEIGGWVAATVWLQGHVLERSEVRARYEGVDHEYETSEFWGRLRRDN
jgi:hypothetical protein